MADALNITMERFITAMLVMVARMTDTSYADIRRKVNELTSDANTQTYRAADDDHTFQRNLDHIPPQVAAELDLDTDPATAHMMAWYCDTPEPAAVEPETLGRDSSQGRAMLLDAGAADEVVEGSQARSDAAHDATTVPTSEGFSSYLQRQLESAREFADALKELQRLGLNQQVLAQLAITGPGALPFIRALLAGGSDLVMQFNGTQRAIDAIAKESIESLVPAELGTEPADPVRIDLTSAFALAEEPTVLEIEAEGRVSYVVVSGKQDDGLWGPIGAMWLSEDRRRGGFLVYPWALWEGSEIVRGYGGALERHWSPEQIYCYWKREVWRGSYSVDEEREAETLFLVSELVNAL